jgi:hypothetical protein
MPKMEGILALDGYTPPTKPAVLDVLTKAQQNTIKMLVRNLLESGPLPSRVLQTKVVHFARIHHGMRIRAYHVAPLLEEMRAAKEFASGYGGAVEPAPAEPLGPEPK